MSERLAEIERRMRSCLSEIEGLRAQRLALHGVSYPDVETKTNLYTSPEEWERRSKIALAEAKIRALEAEYRALATQKVAAELDLHIERETGRAKQEPSPVHSYAIGSGANRHVTERLDDAEQDARSQLREVRLRYMTDREREAYERRQRERQQERRQDHGPTLGY